MDPGSSTRTLSRKLKDSCDLCSASKVRCEKGKPACARCTSMNEPCLYSPARRAGRPRRRLRRESCPEQGQGQNQHDLERPSTSTAPQEAHASDILLADLDWGSEISNFDDNTLPGTTRVPPYAHERGQSEPDPSAPLAGESDDTTVLPREDCAKTAARILETLDPTKARSHHRWRPGGCEMAEACRQILTILVCPCSEQPAVALLVASGCLALMDTACRLARGHETAGPAVAGNDDDDDMNSLHWLNLPMALSPQPTASSNRLVGGADEVGVEGLAKIAKVVLQFAQRYAPEPHKGKEARGGGTGRAYTAQLVEPIVALLRSTLHSVTQEVTARLVL
ncbi:hypothetical protein PG984_006780 [Apiospora sp. TS-2023a]